MSEDGGVGGCRAHLLAQFAAEDGTWWGHIPRAAMLAQDVTIGSNLELPGDFQPLAGSGSLCG
eukprot:8678813-Lingulodinium_polyedra.AAC.1